ncbi:MAG: hypothetical protein HXY51_14660 [Nitrospirae bacterium]|nr:hypothetical protein [Nitrospirota bacterium]
MPHGHLSYLQPLPHGLVNSQELEIARLSVSGTAFAFALEKITFLQGKIAMDNQHYKYPSQALGGRGWRDGRFSSRTKVEGRNPQGFEKLCQKGQGKSPWQGEGDASCL